MPGKHLHTNNNMAGEDERMNGVKSSRTTHRHIEAALAREYTAQHSVVVHPVWPPGLPVSSGSYLLFLGGISWTRKRRQKTESGWGTLDRNLRVYRAGKTDTRTGCDSTTDNRDGGRQVWTRQACPPPRLRNIQKGPLGVSEPLQQLRRTNLWVHRFQATPRYSRPGRGGCATYIAWEIKCCLPQGP